MEPKASFLAHAGDILQGIDRADINRSYLPDHTKGDVTRGHILVEHALESLDIHPEIVVTRHRPNSFTAQIQQVSHSRDRDMTFMVRHIDGKSALMPLSLQAFDGGVVWCGVAKSREQGSEVGHRAPAGEKASALGRVSDQLRDPGDGAALDFRG